MKYIAISAVIIATFLLTGCTIRLPDTEVVTRIEIGEISTSDQEKIDAIMSALSGARWRSWRAMNDTPLTPNQLAISPYGMFEGEEVLMARLFLYEENGREYIWNSYVGIYRISQENIDKIRQIYAEMRSLIEEN